VVRCCQKSLAAKTYFFFGYEGFNFPQSSLQKQAGGRTATLRAGIIQINEGGTYVPLNINPRRGDWWVERPMLPAVCGAGACDPRGIGINADVAQIWNKFMPLPNNFNTGDAHNVEGFQGQVSLPETFKVPGRPRRP